MYYYFIDFKIDQKLKIDGAVSTFSSLLDGETDKFRCIKCMPKTSS